MAVSTLLKFMAQTPVPLVLRMNKTLKEFFRAGFISTAMGEGIYDILVEGPASPRDICARRGWDCDEEGLTAWLEVGVALGELKQRDGRYAVSGVLSRQLMEPANETWRAFFRVRVEVFREYVVVAPRLLKDGKKLAVSEAYGELFAQSSRTVEPIILEVVDRFIPRNRAHRLLEVGCGSGVYIKRACERNPQMRATGLELQDTVADYARENMRKWGIMDRVMIAHGDVRRYRDDRQYDTVTLHNLIYYFPVCDRIEVLRALGGFLAPGGQLLLTTLVPAKDPSIQLMNLWASMTEGYGPLPSPEVMQAHLSDAGFSEVRAEQLIPAYWLFTARKG